MALGTVVALLFLPAFVAGMNGYQIESEELVRRWLEAPSCQNA